MNKNFSFPQAVDHLTLFELNLTMIKSFLILGRHVEWHEIVMHGFLVVYSEHSTRDLIFSLYTVTLD